MEKKINLYIPESNGPGILGAILHPDSNFSIEHLEGIIKEILKSMLLDHTKYKPFSKIEKNRTLVNKYTIKDLLNQKEKEFNIYIVPINYTCTKNL